VNEFSYQGEVTVRPRESPRFEELTSYLYYRNNVAGPQREWWFHRDGCELWFLAERDTRTNEVLNVELPRAPAGAPGPAAPSVPEPPAT
jgi:sarcosine oxidase subunit delta